MEEESLGVVTGGRGRIVAGGNGRIVADVGREAGSP